jgi:hypothetical protein
MTIENFGGLVGTSSNAFHQNHVVHFRLFRLIFSQHTTIMASDNNDNQPASTFEEASVNVQVDNHDTRSRFVDPEGLVEESRRSRLNQEDVNEDSIEDACTRTL